MVNDHSDSERGNLLPPHGLLFSMLARVLLYASSHKQDNRITHTTAFVTPVVEHWLGTCRPWQHVDVVGSKEVLYDFVCMKSGVVMLINDITWLLLEIIYFYFYFIYFILFFIYNDEVVTNERIHRVCQTTSNIFGDFFPILMFSSLDRVEFSSVDRALSGSNHPQWTHPVNNLGVFTFHITSILKATTTKCLTSNNRWLKTSSQSSDLFNGQIKYYFKYIYI